MTSRAPQSRYVLPSFVERTSYGVKESNPYNKLFEERIIFLGVQIDDASANDVMAQLLYLEPRTRTATSCMYINSPGGSFTSLMAIYDTMQFVRPDIQTSASARPPRRPRCCWPPAPRASGYALPNARILIHQPATEGVYGQVSDLEIQANEIQRVRAPAGDHAGPAHQQDAGRGPPGHRARQDPDRRGGQGLRHRRRGAAVPEAVALQIAEAGAASRPTRTGISGLAIVPVRHVSARTLVAPAQRHADGYRQWQRAGPSEWIGPASHERKATQARAAGAPEGTEVSGHGAYR